MRMEKEIEFFKRLIDGVENSNHAAEQSMESAYKLLNPSTKTPRPRLCLDIFQGNADSFIESISSKIAKARDVRSTANEGGDYYYTLSRYLGMLGSAKIAATAHRDIAIQKALETSKGESA